ncbi:16S rRNA (cytosine(1402)-N(4))-methyltransferase [Allobacillus sp. SKP2-8]|uniref:tRNA (mnm(5)s(2)U34)-methyltransferase n=1 Tax=unclassified Allobacillus TaxID=2628859 RepID=UPI00118381F7|nr:class I SAM-dependent methyltransferase [Allobacillus sp. SKP2-8]TSJ61206.1 16S rRNA (cytosine(1402)-N(4))-methyltransferase [Allobacillus sp. SKP2-8]
MLSIIPFIHQLFTDTIHEGDIVVDATLGNGHDSLVLSNLVGDNGKVFAFDIQQEAIDQANQRFSENNRHNIYPFLKGHEKATDILDEHAIDEIDGAIFNLGYLPGSDQQITTTETTTIQAIERLLDRLKSGGHIGIVIYPGHPEGRQEKEAVMDYLRNLPSKIADVAKYEMVNRSERAPFAVVIQKK